MVAARAGLVGALAAGFVAAGCAWIANLESHEPAPPDAEAPSADASGSPDLPDAPDPPDPPDTGADVAIADGALEPPRDVRDEPRAEAAPPTCPNCGVRALCISNACVQARRVFISSTTSAGNFGGPDGADRRCQDLAAAAALGGTWKAWVSNATTSPSTRFTKATVPYRLLDGTQLARAWDDLIDGNLDHRIDRDEKGVQLGAPAEVWTETKQAGVYSGERGACGGFSSNDVRMTALVGVSDQQNGVWTELWQQYCDRQLRLYCFEQ